MDLIANIPLIGGFLSTVIPFAVVLGIVVAVHEYGHYIVARWCGIHSEVFSIGFGPVLWSRTDRRGTLWQLAAIPLGGYVRFFGDSDGASRADDTVLAGMSAQERERSFHGAAVWKRMLTVLAGPVANFLLTIAVSLGATVWIFQDGHLLNLLNIGAPAPVVSFIPVILIGVLFGLAMDYELFLVSRMREEYHHTGEAGRSVLMGLGQSGRVVTAAALIMSAVFGSFLIGDDAIIKTMAFALALGVMIDAFVVRMTLVPAIMFLLGDRAWWMPKWLDRVLPNVDIEGASLPARSSDAPSHTNDAPAEATVPAP